MPMLIALALVGMIDVAGAIQVVVENRYFSSSDCSGTPSERSLEEVGVCRNGQIRYTCDAGGTVTRSLSNDNCITFNSTQTLTERECHDGGGYSYTWHCDDALATTTTTYNNSQCESVIDVEHGYTGWCEMEEVGVFKKYRANDACEAKEERYSTSNCSGTPTTVIDTGFYFDACEDSEDTWIIITIEGCEPTQAPTQAPTRAPTQPPPAGTADIGNKLALLPKMYMLIATVLLGRQLH